MQEDNIRQLGLICGYFTGFQAIFWGVLSLIGMGCAFRGHCGETRTGIEFEMLYFNVSAIASTAACVVKPYFFHAIIVLICILSIYWLFVSIKLVVAFEEWSNKKSVKNSSRLWISVTILVVAIDFIISLLFCADIMCVATAKTRDLLQETFAMGDVISGIGTDRTTTRRSWGDVIGGLIPGRLNPWRKPPTKKQKTHPPKIPTHKAVVLFSDDLENMNPFARQKPKNPFDGHFMNVAVDNAANVDNSNTNLYYNTTILTHDTLAAGTTSWDYYDDIIFNIEPIDEEQKRLPRALGKATTAVIVLGKLRSPATTAPVTLLTLYIRGMVIWFANILLVFYFRHRMGRRIGTASSVCIFAHWIRRTFLPTT